MTRNKTIGRTFATFGIATLISACGADTSELEAAQAEAAAAGSEATELQSDLEAKLTTIAELEAELASSSDLIETQTEAADQLTNEIETLRSELADAESDRSAAQAELEAVRIQFDPEIKAAAQAAWDAELAEACDAAGNGTGLISSFVDHTEEMSAIGTRAQLVDAVTLCAEPLRSRSEAEKLDAECSPGDVDAVLRDTDGFVGDCLVMHVIPWQWDSRTGECTFLGSWDPNNLGARYSYKYDGDGIFRAGPSVCGDGLADADQDDLLKVWVTVTGTFRYDTAAGGTNEIPDFTLRRVELVAKG